VIELVTEMEQKDHQQASDKIAAHYALAVPSAFLIRILSRLRRHRAIENRVGRQNQGIGGLACASIPARKALA
jgi:DNA-binding IscR family transcriptional regulator